MTIYAHEECCLLGNVLRFIYSLILSPQRGYRNIHKNHSHNCHALFSLIEELLGRMKHKKDGAYGSIQARGLKSNSFYNKESCFFPFRIAYLDFNHI